MGLLAPVGICSTASSKLKAPTLPTLTLPWMFAPSVCMATLTCSGFQTPLSSPHSGHLVPQYNAASGQLAVTQQDLEGYVGLTEGPKSYDYRSQECFRHSSVAPASAWQHKVLSSSLKTHCPPPKRKKDSETNINVMERAVLLPLHAG